MEIGGISCLFVCSPAEVPCSPGGHLEDSTGQSPHGITVSSEISHGLYVKGLIEDQSVNCLIDTGAVKTVLSNRVYGRLPQSHRFPLRNENTDIVQGTVTVNGEVIDCHDSQNQLLSFRCMVRRSVIVDANSEVVIPVTIKKRRVVPTLLTTDHGLRILEPCNNSHLQEKGLFIARTLVNVGDASTVPARILNLSDEPQILQSNTVVALAKPVLSVREIDLPEDVNGSNMEPQQTQGQGLEMDDNELPEPLKGLAERSSANLKEEERQQVVNLLKRYKQVFSMNDWDLGMNNEI